GGRSRAGWSLFAGRAVRLGDAQCMMLDGTALSILLIAITPLLGGLALLLPFQLARGYLEGVIQPRVLSVTDESGRARRIKRWASTRFIRLSVSTPVLPRQ